MSIFDQSEQSANNQFNAARDINFFNVETEQHSPHYVFNLPNLKETVYDRESETSELLRALLGDAGFENQFWLLVAPSGFGKSFLLTKVLQEVTDGYVIKAEYDNKIQRIIRFDCREIQSLEQIINDFNNIFFSQIDYDIATIKNKQNWLNKHLFPEAQKVGTTWLILENFETWLNKDKSIINEDLQIFLNSLLEGNHTFRILIISQTPPDSDVKKKFIELKTVGEELYKGLPESYALEYLRVQGKDVGLDLVNEELLKDFLLRVAYIPQALSSLIGYLQSIEGYTFEQFMADDDLWRGFDDYESETDDGNLAKRRTKALISKQIQAQPEDVKFILSVLAFIGKKTPREILELFFKSSHQAAPSISCLTTHRLATLQINSRGIIYYELHTYFLEQSKKYLIETLKDWFLQNGFAYGKRAFEKGFELHKIQSYDLSLEITEFVENIIRFLSEKSESLENDFALASILINKSDALRNLADYNNALISINEAVKLLRNLNQRHEIDDIKIRLSTALYEYGVILSVSNQAEESISYFDEAIGFFRIFDKQGKKELRTFFARALDARASSLSEVVNSETSINTHYKESLENYEQAILILRQTIKRESNPEIRMELLKDLAMTLLNKGTTLYKFYKFEDAVEACNEALKTLFKLLEKNRERASLLEIVAMAYKTKALTSEGLGNYPEAMEYYNQAVMTWFNGYKKSKLFHLFPDFLRTLRGRFVFCVNTQHFKEASLDIVSAAEALNEYLQIPDVANSLKQAAWNQFGEMLISLRELSAEHQKKVYENTGRLRTMFEHLIEQNISNI